MGAGDVDVVGAREGGAERDFVGEVVEVECGALRGRRCYFVWSVMG